MGEFIFNSATNVASLYLLVGSGFCPSGQSFIGEYVLILLKQKPLKMQMACSILASPQSPCCNRSGCVTLIVYETTLTLPGNIYNKTCRIIAPTSLSH